VVLVILSKAAAPRLPLGWEKGVDEVEELGTELEVSFAG